MTPEEKSLERLLKAIEAANIDTVSPSELVELFETVVAVIKEILENSKEEVDEKLEIHKDKLDDDFITKTSGLVDKIKGFETKLNDVKVKLSDKIDEKVSGVLNELKKQVVEIKNLVDENSVKNIRVELDNLSKKVEENEPDTPTETRDKLESLKGNERLDASAIKGLDERVRGIIGTGGQSSTNHSIVGRDVIIDIDLSPQLDGVTTTFNIRAVYNIISVSLSSFPYGSLRKNIDYTYTSTTITFTSEIIAAAQLSAGQKCIITAVAA